MASSTRIVFQNRGSNRTDAVFPVIFPVIPSNLLLLYLHILGLEHISFLCPYFHFSVSGNRAFVSVPAQLLFCARPLGVIFPCPED